MARVSNSKTNESKQIASHMTKVWTTQSYHKNLVFFMEYVIIIIIGFYMSISRKVETKVQFYWYRFVYSRDIDLIKCFICFKVPPYPTDEYMQDRLVTQMNWESYKDILINNIVEESKGYNHDRYSYKCPGIKLWYITDIFVYNVLVYYCDTIWINISLNVL